jgi:hypothetical protein
VPAFFDLGGVESLSNGREIASPTGRVRIRPFRRAGDESSAARLAGKRRLISNGRLEKRSGHGVDNPEM